MTKTHMKTERKQARNIIHLLLIKYDEVYVIFMIGLASQDFD